MCQSNNIITSRTRDEQRRHVEEKHAVVGARGGAKNDVTAGGVDTECIKMERLQLCLFFSSSSLSLSLSLSLSVKCACLFVCL